MIMHLSHLSILTKRHDWRPLGHVTLVNEILILMGLKKIKKIKSIQIFICHIYNLTLMACSKKSDLVLLCGFWIWTLDWSLVKTFYLIDVCFGCENLKTPLPIILSAWSFSLYLSPPLTFPSTNSAHVFHQHCVALHSR